MKRVAEIWGTAIGVDVRDDVAPSALDEVFDWFHEVDALFSTWRDDSEIVRLAGGTLRPEHASPAVREVLALSERLRAETDGAFDIRATSQLPPPHPDGWCVLDASGIVKGWALERAAAALSVRGATRFSINAGGDVLTRGEASRDQPWRVGIQHPWHRNRVAAVVALTDGAVATSGRYERGNHVVDPRSGRPATGLASVSVIGTDLAAADAYATAVLAIGLDGLDFLSTRPNIAAIVVTDEKEVLTTPAAEMYLAAVLR